MLAEESLLLFLYSLGPKLKIGALMPGWRIYECSAGPMGLWKNSCMFRSCNSEIQGLALFSTKHCLVFTVLVSQFR